MSGLLAPLLGPSPPRSLHEPRRVSHPSHHMAVVRVPIEEVPPLYCSFPGYYAHGRSATSDRFTGGMTEALEGSGRSLATQLCSVSVSLEDQLETQVMVG